MGYINKKLYKKKSPFLKNLKNAILYGVLMLACFLLGAWAIGVIFLILTGFSAYQTFKHWGEEGYSLADYIHSYDDEFPVEDPTKKEKSERDKKYNDFIAKVEEDLGDFDIEEDEDDEDEEYGSEDEDDEYEECDEEE